jgi:hypothetical protein
MGTYTEAGQLFIRVDSWQKQIAALQNDIDNRPRNELLSKIDDAEITSAYDEVRKAVQDLDKKLHPLWNLLKAHMP